MRRRILIDGYNLALTRGTGVATYGRTLSHGLRDLGFAVDVVYGPYRRRDTADPVLREVEFFDPPIRPADAATIMGHEADVVRRVPRALLRGARLREVPVRGAVITNDLRERLPHFDRVLTGADLFALANACFALTGHRLRVHMPDPPAIAHWTYPLPIRLVGARNIYTVHDLVPIRLPHTTLDIKRNYVRLLRNLAARADRIVTVSEHSKRDIATVLGVPEARVAVTFQAISPSWTQPASEDAIRHLLARLYGVSPGSYLLFVGAIEPKKNLGRLIEAYLLSDVSMPLLVAGPRAWKADQELMPLKRAGPLRGGKEVRRLDYVPADQLRLLMRGAVCLAFPSLYEGFGLPMVEAMAHGTPVIASHTGALPEIGGDAPLYIDPYETDEIRRALERVVGDAGLREEMRRKGIENAKRFTPTAYRAHLAALYETL